MLKELLDFKNWTDNAATASAWIVGFLVAIGMSFQKLVKNWNESSAGNTLIVTLREEVDRLAKQNETISKMISEQQLEIINLNKIIGARTSRIDELEREVKRLRALLADHPELGGDSRPGSDI